jgi:hypothetical protein
MALLGPYIPFPHLSEHKFHRICSLPSEFPSQVYFNVPESCRKGRVSVIGCHMKKVDSPLRPPHGRSPPQRDATSGFIEGRSGTPGHEGGIVLENVQVPCPEALISLSPYPARYVDEYPWYYSSCSLAGIEEITVCRRPLKARSCDGGPSRAVIGMLVRYGTDLVVSVGQVRLDSMGEPIAVADTNRLGIKVGRLGQKSVTIADINVYPESLSSVWADVIMVPPEGTLIWWFIPFASRLEHHNNGRVSRLCGSRRLRELLL